MSLNTPKLVIIDISEHGFDGESYYYTRAERLGISKEELLEVGIRSSYAYVHPDLIEPLKKANELFERLGYRIFIKDAYRSEAAYHLAQKKLYEKQGKELTDAMLNMVRMPHATGRAVDIVLLDIRTGKEVYMRDGSEDKDGAWKIGYYANKSDPKSQEYFRLQTLLIDTMLSLGFVLGTKGEYWHFEYPWD